MKKIILYSFILLNSSNLLGNPFSNFFNNSFQKAKEHPYLTGLGIFGFGAAIYGTKKANEKGYFDKFKFWNKTPKDLSKKNPVEVINLNQNNQNNQN